MHRTLNWVTFLLCVALILLGLWTSIRIKAACNASHLATERHVAMGEASQEMHRASEFLTLLSRQYVITRKMEYAQKYMEEMFHTRSRESALSVLYADKTKKIPGNDSLVTALERSDILAKKELYAMRLIAEAVKADKRVLAELYANSRLTSADAALSIDEKLERATELLFDDAYTMDQYQIMDAIHRFMSISAETARVELLEHIQRMDSLITQLMLIFVGLLLVSCARMVLLFGIRTILRGKLLRSAQ